MTNNQPPITNDQLDVSVLWHSFTRDPDFHGKALSLTTENELGPFDILPQHANLISLIKNQIIVRPKEGAEINYKFRSGVLEASENTVRVFLGI